MILIAAKFFLLLSFFFFFIGMVTRFLGYGQNQGAPWAFGITPDAYLRFANTLVLYSIAFGILQLANSLRVEF